jgi:hypothetical protein
MMLVGSDGVLRFQNIIVSEIATGDQYVYSPFQVCGCFAASHLQQSTYCTSPTATSVRVAMYLSSVCIDTAPEAAAAVVSSL